jgi:hypothetical protein
MNGTHDSVLQEGYMLGMRGGLVMVKNRRLRGNSIKYPITTSGGAKVAAVPNNVISKLFGLFDCHITNCEKSAWAFVVIIPEFDRNHTLRWPFRDGAFNAIAVSAFEIHSVQNLADGSGGKRGGSVRFSLLH